MAKQVVDDNKFTAIRLPTTIKPVHYDLSLKPNFSDFTFAGKVKINYTSGTSALNSIVVHSHDLTVTDGAIEAGSKSSSLTTVTYSPTTETATLEFQDAIAPEGILSLVFKGILNDKMKGFYRTSFKVDGTEVHAATTQFESTDARRCFPCWDEPDVKATFSVTMTIEKFITVNGKQLERLVLSNMPEISRSGPDTEVEVKFDKSPIMSTYLLAFIVGPFEVLEGTDGKRPIRVFTTPGKAQHGRFALDVACRALPYYEDYFNVPYPLPKMDLVAIPDFMSGAMENWGLVTYRETCILFDPKNSSTNVKQWIAIVVAHELAHQWFGNLVTMKWWTHLWLNEGFASFMEYLCVDHLFPEYDIWSQFLSNAHGSALSLDALHNSHPIEVPVGRASEIEEIFDDISYAKGASIIRMLYTYIGDESFRKGMKEYLTKFAYKNAQTEDLWDCLEAASGKPVRKIMSGWTSQKGYPWLSIAYNKEGDNVKLTLTQNKFTSDGTLPEGDANNQWMVPISVITGKNPTVPQEICVLQSKSDVITIDNAGDSWIKLNPGTIGLYRSAYPNEMMSKLFEAISQQTLTPMDRLGLQSDYYALCQAGKVNSVDLLKLLLALKNETDLTVWQSIDSCYAHLSLLLRSDTNSLNKFKAFGRDLYSEIFKKLGWTVKENEKHTVSMTRALVIRRLVELNYEGIVDEAKKMFKAHQSGAAAIPADLRAAVYRAVSIYGDAESYENLYTIYKTADLSEEKSRALQALSSATDAARLKRALDFCLSKDVRKQDKIWVLCPASVANPLDTWNFFKENSTAIRKEFEPSHLMTRIVRAVSENFTTDEMAQDVTKFFEQNQVAGAERTVQQSIEQIRSNVAWLGRDGEAIKAFLATF